jgi:hypothetical protein
VTKMNSNWYNKLIYSYCKLVSKVKSKNTFPDDLALDLNKLISQPRLIKVAIIDNKPFPFTEAIESVNCKVSFYNDYTKPIVQAKQKIKTHNFKDQDIIICDIHDVGGAMYPGHEGIGVIENLRKKHPFHIIIAYTGNPGIIAEKLKKPTTIDGTFPKEWEVDDFLFNFEELLKALNNPKNRWEFIRRRLKHLEVDDKRILEIQQAFVENVLMSQMLNQKFLFKASDIKNLSDSSNPSFDPIKFIKFGINASELAALVSPFILDKS